MKIETLDDLLYEDLRELYDQEQRLLEALPNMARGAASEGLRQTLQQHVGQTLEHVNRLDRCFRELNKHAGRETVNAMKGMIKDGERVIDQIPLSPLRDAALIAAAKRVENFEMGAYSGTISFARLLGLENIAATLEQTLREERETEEALSQLADSTVNRDARTSGAHPREQRA